MSLQKLNLQCEYRSDQTNTVTDFYVPCLNVSREYWRAVGYFTSHGLALAARGLSSFVQNDGKMRLVASPMLTEGDISAIQEGYSAREDVVEKAIIRELDGYFTEIVNYRLKCLAWLVAEKRLDIKIASPSELSLNNRGAIYHEKIGIFIDGKFMQLLYILRSSGAQVLDLSTFYRHIAPPERKVKHIRFNRKRIDLQCFGQEEP